jgi:integrase
LLISEVLLKYLEQLWPAPQTGKVPKEVANFRLVVRCVKQLYDDRPATTFGPLALKAVRTHMIEVQDLCRSEVNKRVGRVKRIFKWAVSEELIPSSIYETLRTVEGIRLGKSKAREKPPVKPLSDQDINATLPFLNPQVATMVRVQRFTGMRPGKLVIMRPCDIDQTVDPWTYYPSWRNRPV